MEMKLQDLEQQRNKKNGVAIKLPLIFCSGQMFLYPSGGKRPPFKTKSGFSYFHLDFLYPFLDLKNHYIHFLRLKISLQPRVD